MRLGLGDHPGTRPETDAQHRAHSLRAREGKVRSVHETAAEWSSRDTFFLYFSWISLVPPKR